MITLLDLATICAIKNRYGLRKKLEKWGVKMLVIQKGKYLIDLESLHQTILKGIAVEEKIIEVDGSMVGNDVDV